MTLPGWYGFGAAVQAFIHRPGKDAKAQLALLQKMYRQWPFFRTLLSNMDMVLAKSDLNLASRYSELVTDTRLRRRIFGAIEAEWQSTVQALNSITGDKQRLEHNSALARSIRHRFPISTRCTICRSSWCALARRPDRRPREERHPSVHQRHCGRCAQHGLRYIAAALETGAACAMHKRFEASKCFKPFCVWR